MMLSRPQIDARRKGGLISQQRRRMFPDRYPNCRIPIDYPKLNKSNDLAELIGVVLGDGCITKEQIGITLNSIKDADYLYYLIDLVVKCLSYSPSISKRKNANAILIRLTGTILVKRFVELGLKIGNKVRQQVSVPDWICKDRSYSISCLRGLIDTDGGVFVHRYKVNNNGYSYLKLCFTNKSQPLRDFVSNTLHSHGLKAKQYSDRRVWLYDSNGVRRYFDIVGSSNNRLLKVVR